tara:strand:+ start:291 stop:1163 length:873 start_codon:yes stop_codon:yes gene_type:complete
MEKDQIIILEDRSLISVSGNDAKEFLQNILTNDIDKVNASNSIFSAIFTPQGKYLYEFFVIKSKNGYFLDCDNEFIKEIEECLNKYKLRSKVIIENLSSEFAIGVINIDLFKEIQINKKDTSNTISYDEIPIFADPRTQKLGARILCNLKKLYLTIKNLKLNIIEKNTYLKNAYLCGIPVKGLKNLQEQLFGLEANFEELQGIDFKKGCFVGQENTARMKLKNKLRRKLLPIKSESELTIGSEISCDKIIIGKVLIGGQFPFALIKVFDPNLDELRNKQIMIDNKKIEII